MIKCTVFEYQNPKQISPKVGQFFLEALAVHSLEIHQSKSGKWNPKGNDIEEKWRRCGGEAIRRRGCAAVSGGEVVRWREEEERRWMEALVAAERIEEDRAIGSWILLFIKSTTT
nr:hypothetical protein Iba_chr11aCG9510 [Ipomoea batatas]